jgi:hypothetical protein
VISLKTLDLLFGHSLLVQTDCAETATATKQMAHFGKHRFGSCDLVFG